MLRHCARRAIALSRRGIARAAQPPAAQQSKDTPPTDEPSITYEMAVREFKHEFVRQRMLDMPRIVAEWREKRRTEALKRKNPLPY